MGLLVAEDREPDRNRLGGTRILIAWLQDKPTAIVYRPTGPGNHPFVFESPVRKSSFQHVAVAPEIELVAKRNRQDDVVTAKIPWQVLHLKPRDGLRLRGDVEVIFGSGQTGYVERIVRWVDRQTNVVNDTPTEAEFFPGRWGSFVLGLPKTTTTKREGGTTHDVPVDPGWELVYSLDFDNVRVEVFTD